jgi:uncharacterized membrane protein (UPF0127 family)
VPRAATAERGFALSPRLRRLPTTAIAGHEVAVAVGVRARLLGLAWLDREGAGAGLLIPRCSSVHTFGMRFVLDLFFLDDRGVVLSVRRGVPPRRLASDRRASAVLELPSGVDRRSRDGPEPR